MNNPPITQGSIKHMVPFNVKRRRLLEDTVGLEFGLRTLHLRCPNMTQKAPSLS
ncbi:hypothetical protein M378DRAFT_670295 [Amanita muscaria Koide BX008]|uniref:Uncharacterized protein n=1 Tax=Amanita muscaria (strain Koide BX008) TaxID=946122 RepID=A0A0C2X2N6_AMAMK|nr:hypothetical protein M378DRAFT_670295 [Amanita muscaria Koide BX008]